MPSIMCSAWSPCTTEKGKQKYLTVLMWTQLVNQGIAFAELVSYIEDSRMDDLFAPVFKLTDLVNLYSTRLGLM